MTVPQGHPSRALRRGTRRRRMFGGADRCRGGRLAGTRTVGPPGGRGEATGVLRKRKGVVAGLPTLLLPSRTAQRDPTAAAAAPKGAGVRCCARPPLETRPGAWSALQPLSRPSGLRSALHRKWVLLRDDGDFGPPLRGLRVGAVHGPQTPRGTGSGAPPPRRALGVRRSPGPAAAVRRLQPLLGPLVFSRSPRVRVTTAPRCRGHLSEADELERRVVAVVRGLWPRG